MRRDVMAVMVLQTAVAGPAAAAADEGPAVASQLEEIVVTARRTEETLQRVPISMYAISGSSWFQTGGSFAEYEYIRFTEL